MMMMMMTLQDPTRLLIASHSSNIITTCVYTARTVFLHLFLFEFTYALLPPSLFTVTRLDL